MMSSQTDLQPIWNKVVDRVKQKIIHPTLWRAVELAVPITAEDGLFVVGFAATSYHMSGNLLTSEHKLAIENALFEFTGTQYKLRVIDSVTYHDWEQVKLKEDRMKVFKEETRRKKEKESAASRSWDTLSETIGRGYAAQPLRQLPQSRARYIEEMFAAISDTMDVLLPSGGPSDELAERSLARVIEKLATLVEAPSSLVALELLRFRRER